MAKTDRPQPKKVRVKVKIEDAKEVVLTGDFTHWSKEVVKLSKDSDGSWQTTLALPPGEHQYRLLVDGAWRNHPEATKCVPNPYGTENCVLVVE
jgi:1,4-alpha-glucan branching enzyme